MSYFGVAHPGRILSAVGPTEPFTRARKQARTYQTFAEPTTFQTGSVAVNGWNWPTLSRVVPFMNHTENTPVGVGLCQRKSAAPSLLKSVLVETRLNDWVVFCVFGYVIVPATVGPATFHAVMAPVAELYSTS